MAEARISVSLREGVIEIEGSESFVIAQLTRFETVIASALEVTAKKSEPSKVKNAVAPEAGAGTGAIDQFVNVFAVSEGKIQILKDIPGATKAQQMVNAAILLTFANSLLGSPTTPYEAIRNTCSAHGCLDSTNFSKSVKAEKDAFIFGGSPHAQTMALSVPGRKRASALATQLNGS